MSETKTKLTIPLCSTLAFSLLTPHFSLHVRQLSTIAYEHMIESTADRLSGAYLSDTSGLGLAAGKA